MLAPHYDGYLLDQWGVLHDGSKPYPQAIDCLERLRAAGKAVIILSNSGRRGSENEAVLASMGFGRDLYDHILSAGDDARDALTRRDEPVYRDLGRRCILLARPGEEHVADGLGLERTTDPLVADFVLNLTMDSQTQSVAGWRPLLERCAAQGLSMVCGNPDRYRVHHDGRLHEAPGLIALAYERMGGTVHYHGKPHPRIYRSCVGLLGLQPARMLAIGDSLEHDVAGAAGAGVDSLFIAGGIHKRDVSWSSAGWALPEDCLRLFSAERIRPRYCLSWFAWEPLPA
jgi:HAD superfamily hydrolase (TIGR01459 family)